MKKVGVALLGLGTVGTGTYKIIKSRNESIKARYGVDICVEHVLERDLSRVDALEIDHNLVSCDINNVINNPNISIVAEFFGGIEPARSFLIAALKAGKSIVTANKELFAKHWPELEEAAKIGKAGLYFEASCVGGVPIIRALTESMQGSEIESMMGIVNGTTNFILSKMADEGQDYATVLAEAQQLGYAEANPSADVDGFDSMYKLSILSTLAFNTKVPIDKIYREGISKINKVDIDYGKELGYTLKLLAIGKRVNGLIEARVHPTFIPNNHPLASVKGSFNAVHIVGDNVGDIMLYGRGAGELPTGSAIVSDIVFASTQNNHKYCTFDNTNQPLSDDNFSKNFLSEFYVRLTVEDKCGVLAQISTIFAKYNVSISSVQQKPISGNKSRIIFLLHLTAQEHLNQAMEQIKSLESIFKIDSIIRVEK